MAKYGSVFDDDAYDSSTFSEILPRLFQGGTPPNEQLHSSKIFSSAAEKINVTCVVTLDAQSQPMPWGVKELRYGFPDHVLEMVDKKAILEVADWAYDHWKQGERLLIRCQAGMNRSGLITALVLMKDGYTSEEAIKMIRGRRSAALSNSYFVKWLQEI